MNLIEIKSFAQALKKLVGLMDGSSLCFYQQR